MAYAVFCMIALRTFVSKSVIFFFYRAYKVMEEQVR